MQAADIMTPDVICAGPETPLAELVHLMLDNRISAVPIVANGQLVGIVSEGDLLRRAETGTEPRPSRWLELMTSSNRLAADYTRTHGIRASEVMTRDVVTVIDTTSMADIAQLLAAKRIKRVPVMRGDKLVGIVSRSNLLQAVASLAREIPDPTADDDHIRNRIIDALEKNTWCPFGLSVTVRDGIVHLSGVITDARSRQAAVVAAENVTGVKTVHDHLCWVDTMSGMYLNSPEDENLAKAS